MKKNYYSQNLNNTDSKLDNNTSNSQIKTTNVNVLLNRVRLEKKKTFNKRIFISLCLTTVVSLLAVFVIIQS